MELESLRLEFQHSPHPIVQIVCSSSSSSSDLHFPDRVLYSSFSSLDLRTPDIISVLLFLLFFLCFLLLPIFFFRSVSCSCSSFFKSTSIELEFKKIKFHVDKLFHVNTKTRALKAWVCHRTRVSKPQDASFLNNFKNMFTNEIFSKIMLYGID